MVETTNQKKDVGFGWIWNLAMILVDATGKKYGNARIWKQWM